MVKYLCADNLQGMKHGFFTKKGGVSFDDYKSLNCGLSTDDDINNVLENRKIILNSLAPKGTILQTMRQVHGTDVGIVSDKVLPEFPKADALVCHDVDVMLGVLTADCAPILFCDEVNGVIGVAHAGWRSAFGGIVAKTVEKMEYMGGEKQFIHMAVGPCIQQQSYEIDTPFYKSFLEQSSNNKDFFIDIDGKENHWLFDLPAYLVRQGEELNIGSVSAMSEDTYIQEDNFFSHRRHIAKHEHGRCGRQLSVITMY